jgi:uncharacterized protein (TIGR02246 family)
MNKFIVILCTITIISLVACKNAEQRQAETRNADTAALLRSIDTLAAKMGEAHAKKDAALFGSTWMEDGIMSLPGQPMAVGKDAIVNSFKNQPALPPGADFKINPLEIKVIDKDWAYAFGVDSLTMTPVGYNVPQKQTFTFLVLLRNTPDGWKNYREVLSANQ